MVRKKKGGTGGPPFIRLSNQFISRAVSIPAPTRSKGIHTQLALSTSSSRPANTNQRFICVPISTCVHANHFLVLSCLFLLAGLFLVVSMLIVDYNKEEKKKETDNHLSKPLPDRSCLSSICRPVVCVLYRSLLYICMFFGGNDMRAPIIKICCF